MSARRRILVLASGGGSNLNALLARLDDAGEARPADVVAVASDRPNAGALRRAAERRIEAVVLRGRASPEGESLDGAVARLAPDIVVLAGYLRLVPPDIVRGLRGRMLNVHPALLPAFGGPGMYGRRVHEAVLAAGVSITGPSVHFVDEIYDHGAIAAQWPVPVLPGDDADALAARVLEAEHRLFPSVVLALAHGALTLAPDGRAHWTTAPPHAALAAGLAAPPSHP